MSLTVSADWSYRGLQALVLDNGLVRVVVLPELGGKIWELRDLVTGRQFLWQNPRIAPTKVPYAAGYDDQFFGGWDVLFPNDMPESIGGEEFPDHGEVWTLAWQWDLARAADSVSVHLEVMTPISACRLRKTVSLLAGERCVRVHESLENVGDRDLPFLWKQHLALEVDEVARIDLPAGDMLLGDFGNPRAGHAGLTYRWPRLSDADGAIHDMSITLPRESRCSEFQYATGLSAGWCALTHKDGNGLVLRFDPDVFRSCWTFASYGGWRDLQVAVMEPCTGYPVSVAEGHAAGTHQTLVAGASISTELVAVLFQGMRRVTGVTEGLQVEGEAT
jgi:hypothetical protein